MIKGYRYIIYKLYSWRIRKKDDTPIATVIIMLSFVHYVQLFILYLIALKFFPNINIFSSVNKTYVATFLILFGIIHYFLIYNKEHWQQYIEEFSNESKEESKRGRILVIAYLVGSILLFFILMPILFGA